LEAFSVENDMLTPTMKLKRNVAKKVYDEEIEKTYGSDLLKMPKK
jgi:long-subunit acyl-CoA synthetase (AMP-forming)